MKKVISNKLFLALAILFLIVLAFGAFYFANKKLNLTKNCPKYIDCMPGPGRSAACEIPAGCEGYTQFAY